MVPPSSESLPSGAPSTVHHFVATTALPLERNLQQLKDLLLARAAYVEDRTNRRKRIGELDPGPAAAALGRLNEATDREIGVLDQAIAKALEADEALARRAAILRSVAGIGPVSAAVLCADLPELGSIGPKQVAALADTAPFASDSGASHGARHIRGGRPRPRKVLYMAAIAARRSNPDMRAPSTSGWPTAASPIRSQLPPSSASSSCSPTPCFATTASGNRRSRPRPEYWIAPDRPSAQRPEA